MWRTETDSPSLSPNTGDLQVFNVVIAYEDFEAGSRAKQAYDFLVANLTHEWRVNHQMWKFDVLGVPELREMAARDAAKASLIIVSSHSDQELPAEVEVWIEMWLTYPRNSVALMALFDCPPEGAERAQMAQAYLEGVAKRGGLEFFTWPELWPGQARLHNAAFLDTGWDRTEEVLYPLAATAPRDGSLAHWGLNE